MLDRDLINTVYLIVKDNVNASHTFDKLVKQKVESMLRESDMTPVRSSLQHELLILASLMQKCDEDSCWLARFRLVVHILVQSVRRPTNCRLVNELTLPCLRIVAHLVKSSTCTANNNNNSKKIDLDHSVADARILLSSRQTDTLSDDSLLKLKYLLSWKQAKEASVFATDLNWLRACLFCASSRSVRQLTASLVQNLFSYYSTSCVNDERKFIIVDFVGEHAGILSRRHDDHHLDYCDALKHILTSSDRDSKYRLVVKHKMLAKLELLIQAEIKQLNETERLSDDSLLGHSFDLNRGLCIKTLGELLALFLKEAVIKTKFKSRLIGTVLNAYLSLKKLLYERTKLIDEAQEKLLNTLELLTSGTEQETRHFMSICIDTVRNFDLDDLVTPVFIFERLSNIIYPEDVVDNKQFLIVLEKDPNQEDYLQGRMLGNPYSSSEPGLGPLMRNIKNKICTDSELIALLEDDNGMELLVNNKIISLELSVRDVYKKVWLSECLSEHEPMRVVYRMTGLLGDATEDIIDNLEPKKLDAATQDDEQQQVYRMADELAYSGALPVMLERLASINQQNFSVGKPLLRVLLKLFDYALKLKVNRAVLIRPQLKAISTMLQTLNMMLKLQVDVSLTERLIAIMQVILSEASQQPPDVYNQFSALCGHTEQLQFLLSNIKSTYVRGYSNLMQALMGLIPFLSFADQTKMKMLIEHFSTYVCNFDGLDSSGSNEDTLHLECFCVIVNGIESGPNGTRLRDMMSSSGIVQNAIDYLLHNSPPITTYFNSDNELWHHFIGRKSLPYALRILTGLSKSHRAISDSIGGQCVPVLHKLEQFTSENLVGVIAEDLLAVLRQNGSHQVTSAIQQMQEQTKSEKKKLAMAKRNKQLSQLGMKTNDKGQLLINPDSLKSIQVEEEKGHVCCICRDGYKYNPQKLLAIYTFSKKCELEPYENKARKTVGFSTVTHFNLVHAECHTNAIRSSRTCRDEWENAALQNANTKCNGILPIWGPQVTDTLFSNALARHNNYLLDATGIRDLNYSLYVHDLKALLNRFAQNLSFSEDTGGGGRESNINLVPYIIHAILYSLNTAKYVQKEEQNVAGYLAHTDKLVQNSFECDNVFYYMSLSLCVMRADEWKAKRVEFLQRAVCTVHARLVNGAGGDKTKLASTVLLEFKKYKPCVLFVGIVDLFFKHLMAKVTCQDGDRPWTELLATYIRHNDVAIMEFCKKILHQFEQELMVSEDWLEMFDVLGFLRHLDIADPVEFLTAYLQSVGK
ncbi:E3 ubiquitin- ligase UBR4-like [Brachionus plicatilis]|uniref:E3 ubiquitin-ligase UBR4-like n=1 Tax=Brachionus plicatilis TaxID=10195 RepID=A0A3M7PLU4_BRAPC|nr:E3 ubiquitin- ligase UBR4-like [Brachionus plicatilis]